MYFADLILSGSSGLTRLILSAIRSQFGIRHKLGAKLGINSRNYDGIGHYFLTDDVTLTPSGNPLTDGRQPKNHALSVAER